MSVCMSLFSDITFSEREFDYNEDEINNFCEVDEQKINNCFLKTQNFPIYLCDSFWIVLLNSA